jgi:glycosyltransferase involved in cell wall biosynthesis
MTYTLTVYPLTQAFRRRLSAALSTEPTYLNLSEWRCRPFLETVRLVRSLKGSRLVLAIEDETSVAVLPALAAVAALSSASEIEIRYPDLRSETVSRGDLARNVAAVAAASVRAGRDAIACGRDLRRLLRVPRVTVARADRRRALYVNANLWFGVKAGGSIGHIAGVVNAFGQAGLDVDYASAGGRTLISDAVAARPLRAPAKFGMPPELNQYTFHRHVVEQLRQLAPPDFIYQRLSIGNYAGVALSRVWRRPLVVEYNGSEVWIAEHWGRRLRFPRLAADAEAACLRHAHVVVTISNVLREDLIDRGVDAERIVTYPNGIDPAVFDPGRFAKTQIDELRRRIGVPDAGVMVAFVGTFGQWHGAELLARVIRRLVDTEVDWLRRMRVRFVLIGDGLRMPAVREILGDTQEFVTLTGLVPQAEAPAYVAAADVLVSPHVPNGDGSRFFGSPTKLFEYMAMGKAIVASDLEQIGEVLRHSVRVGELPSRPPDADEQRLSLLFEPGDESGLQSSIKFAVDRADWRAALGRNARRDVLANYTWPHHVGAILDRLRALHG